MKQKDLIFIKDLLNKSTFAYNYLTIVKQPQQDKQDFKTLKILYNDKVLTITEIGGFAYLISWWCDGSITSGFANEITNICKLYNDRF